MAAGLIYAQQVLPRHSPGWVAAILGYALGFPILCLAGWSLVKRARRRWLVERAGYVEYLPFKIVTRQNLWALAAMLVLMPLAFLAFNYSERLQLLFPGALGRRSVGWSDGRRGWCA